MTSRLVASLLFAALLTVGCAARSNAPGAASDTADAAQAIDPALADTATFAGGCFWCMEPPYDKLEGVVSTTSGFSGGSVEDPSYEEVTYGDTGHAEVVQVVYDSTKVGYKTLLNVYWHNIDPLDGSGQFCDRGSSYRPAIYAHTPRQRQLAEETKSVVAQQFDAPVQVEIEAFEAFYAAEDYHQNYYQKNPTEYKRYRSGCGRDARLEELWGERAGTAQPLAMASGAQE
jgi:peptide-methionine (S)-S-oxide reductase